MALSLYSSVHRSLRTRIAALGLIVSVVFGALTALADRRARQDEILQLARLEVDRFQHRAHAILDDPASLPSAIQDELDAFVEAGGERPNPDGAFVMVRISTRSGQVVAERIDTTYSALAQVRTEVDATPFVSLGPDDARLVHARLAGSPHVGVAIPLLDSEGTVAAQIGGVFAVSDQAIARSRARLLRTILYVVGIVLFTALALYPVIRGLLGRLSSLTDDLLDANLETMRVLGSAIAKRDSDTDAHNFRVTVYAVALAEAMNLPERQIQGLIKGALLHDVGKIGIRDDVLLKPGTLDDAEYAIMKTHVDHGVEITARAGWLEDAREVVEGHHERFDGEGYPRGMVGQAIPLSARIFAIADVFDALTSRRPYKEAMSFEQSMEILEAGRGTHFDPRPLDAFCQIARQLFDEFANQLEVPRLRLETLSHTYFKSDVSALLR